MHEPTYDERAYKQKGWNTGIDRHQFIDKKRMSSLRSKWRQYLKERKEKYNSTNESKP